MFQFSILGDKIDPGVAKLMIKIRACEFQCAACGVVFTVSTNLRNHIEAKHYTPGYKCDQCEAILKTKNNLNYHRVAYHTYICQICQTSFRTKSALNNHQLECYGRFL